MTGPEMGRQAEEDQFHALEAREKQCYFVDFISWNEITGKKLLKWALWIALDPENSHHHLYHN